MSWEQWWYIVKERLGWQREFDFNIPEYIIVAYKCHYEMKLKPSESIEINRELNLGYRPSS